MSEEQYTRCPACRTIFRVTARQLALRDGQVRCGHCHTAFDGNAQRVDLAPEPRAGAEPEYDDAALGPPTVTLRSARSLEPMDEEAQPPRRASDEGLATIAYEERFAWANRKPRRALAILYGVGTPLLLLVLAGQTLYHFRDHIAARWPQAKPALVALCRAAGCTVHPLADIGALSIDASDLQADPSRRGLLTLTATIRNRAAWPLAFPYFELTLTDVRDQPVVRRAFAPTEYAGAAADVASGIPGNGEVAVKMYLDASATTQAGYRLYLFYP